MSYGAKSEFLDKFLKEATDGASFSFAGIEFQHLGAIYLMDRWSQRSKNIFFLDALVLY